MKYLQRPGWTLPESAVTPESAYLSRRTVVQAGSAMLASSALAATGLLHTSPALAAPTDDLYPAKKNPAFRAGPRRTLTPEEVASTYNNFYEFGTDKRISRRAQALVTDPWEIRIDGEVDRPLRLQFDELVRKMPLEERIYRLRCVEAWSMVIPWTGFAMRHLVELARPTSRATYVRFETFVDKKVAPGQRSPYSNFPYVEGLTLAEANNDLAFLVTGTYGKPAAKQFGAPIRLALPWKYGFKSIKSIVRISFTASRPVSFWEKAQGQEYGFWANVNPAFDHPRWSQASERVVHSGDRIPTLRYNGYEEYVGSMYAPYPQNRSLFF